MSLVGSALAAVVAALAAGVPLLTFVYTYTLKARIEMRVGEEIILHYTNRKLLILTSDFIFLNKGAQQAAVTGVYGTIWRDTDSRPASPNLDWEKYEKSERTKADEPYHTHSIAIVEPIVIPGRSAFNARMRLYSHSPLQLEGTDGYYFLRLEFADGSSNLKLASTNYILHLRKDDAEDLLANGAEELVDNGKRSVFRARISLKRSRPVPDSVPGHMHAGLPDGRLRPKNPKRSAMFESRGRWKIE
jgi:hypothetical protein